METITSTCRNKTHFAQVFISVILTEMNVHFCFVNTGARDEIRPTANILFVCLFVCCIYPPDSWENVRR